MYNRVYKFFEKFKLIYSLQFGFRQHFLSTNGLLNLTELIMTALDECNIACGTFIDLQKPFDTVEPNTL